MGYLNRQNPSLEKQTRQILGSAWSKSPQCYAQQGTVRDEMGEATPKQHQQGSLARGSLGAWSRDRPEPIALSGHHSLSSLSLWSSSQSPVTLTCQFPNLRGHQSPPQMPATCPLDASQIREEGKGERRRRPLDASSAPSVSPLGRIRTQVPTERVDRKHA